ncbi:MAG TPA: TolC family protein [Terriglobales bacterium]|nr:TolC family protein [Terriglobales bacterium]
MQSFTGLTAFRRVAAFFIAAFFVVAGIASASPAQDTPVPSAPSAQRAVSSSSSTQPFNVQEYSKPQSPFPNPIAPYTPRHIDAPNLANTPRIDELMHDGKLYISMNDAVALALENNLDIAIARYNLNIADTDVWRAKAGSAILGVNSGVVQNTPGGGVGGLGTQVGSGQGGTSVGAGGAGAGTGGLVISTLGSGPPITSFDPIVTGLLQIDHDTLLSSSIFSPISPVNTTTGNFLYQQGFAWGTNLALGFNNTRQTAGNAPFTTLSAQLNSSFNFKLTQHLLQGFGFAANTRYIQIAKNDREISDVAFRLQITSTVDQIENMYWDLVYAYENVRVQKEQLAFAQKTLSDSKKQVEIGTLAPIEVVRAQSTVASDQQTLTVALTNLQLEQLLMKNALSRSLVDPTLADAEVIPTSTMVLSAEEVVVPTQDLVNDALSHRPELSEARINLSNTDISNKAIRSALLPTVDLFAYYGGQGLGGQQNPSNLCVNQTPPQTGFCAGPNPGEPTLIPIAPTTSYAGTLNQLVNSTAPDKGAGISISIPLRNRAAQATQVRSEFEYRQAQLHVQQIENQLRIEVRNAQFGVQQNRASVASAQAAVDLARQSLDAEQKKYALGASTSTLVLQNQAAMTQAEVTLVSAKALYEKAEVELERSTGLLLDHAGILIGDAERGQVTHAPSIPHVAPRPADQPVPANPPPQPQQ